MDENYYKLLEDFTTLVDGEYHAQEAVKMVFPDENSAFGSIAELIREGLEEDAVAEGMRSERLGEICDRIERELGKANAAKENSAWDGGVQFSLREFEDGRKFVDVAAEQERFDHLSANEQQKAAKKAIQEKFVGKVIGLTNQAFVNGNTAKEYAFPSKSIKDPNAREAKCARQRSWTICWKPERTSVRSRTEEMGMYILTRQAIFAISIRFLRLETNTIPELLT